MAPPTLTQVKKAAAANSSPAARKSSSSGASSSPTLASSLQTLTDSYRSTTSAKVKLIDCFLLFFLLSGVAQFAYCVLVTSFPYNAFLASFASAVGQFVLLASLRAQVASPAPPAPTATTTGGASSSLPPKPREFSLVSPERAFADFCFASVVLHFFVWNFIG